MTIRKDRIFTYSFPVIDTTNRPARKSGISFSAGDTKISLDGASFNNTTNQPAEIGSSGRYSIAFTAAEFNADLVHFYVEKAGIDPVDERIATGGQPSGTVVTNGGNTGLTFKTDRTESSNDYWRDALILFTSGALIEQVKRISAYDGTTKFITVANTFTTTPTGGDRFVLVNL